MIKNYFKSLGFLLFFSVLILPENLFSQNNVGIGTLQPDSSAILHLESFTKGFLPPRLTTAQRDNINNPKEGLMVFNVTDSIMQYYNGFCWLNTYQENCYECYMNASLSDSSGIIDRTVSNNISLVITINQIAGTPQPIALTVGGNLPNGLTYTLTNNPMNSSGTSILTIEVTTFTPAGTYPIIIQALCGGSIQTMVYSLTILPCFDLFLSNTSNNYNISTELYLTYPNAPTNSPVCVVATVGPGVTVSSVASTDPAFTTGTLPAGSVVAIVNQGNIIGRGGDGGIAEAPANNPPISGDGKDGGDAIVITEATDIFNNGYIFGGGGGGSATAFLLSVSLGNIPVLGNISIGFLIGAGGGGGAGISQGGNLPGIIGITYYSQGFNGTGGIFGVPGMGGTLITPISITQGPVTITFSPNAYGGAGGNYGADGIQGTFNLTLSASVTVSIPFIGPITIPVLNNMPITPPVAPSQPGVGGYAVRTNGNTVNIPLNSYNTSFLKGIVGN
jgi:hypothetical protein